MGGPRLLIGKETREQSLCRVRSAHRLPRTLGAQSACYEKPEIAWTWARFRAWMVNEKKPLSLGERRGFFSALESGRQALEHQLGLLLLRREGG
jgi:hypothetical protein